LKRIFSFQFLLLFNLIFSQIGDLGPLIDKYPDLQIHDSLSFFIHEGKSSQIDYLLEGGALEIESKSVISVTFSIINKRGQSISYSGNIFQGENSGTTFATFTNESKEKLSQFSYTIIATELLKIKSVIGFVPDLGMIQITSRPMNMMDGDVPKPIIVTREEWGAEPQDGQYSYHPYFDKLTLHHAACCSAENIEEGINQVYWIQDFHQNGRGWMDIGYHFLVDRAGNIYQGRPETVIGAHVGGANTGNIGVCLLGCYHPPEESCYETMSDESRESLVKLYAWISDTYGQNPGVLLGHRDYFGTTACPGNNVWSEIPDMRFDIVDYIEMTRGPLISFFQPAYPNPFSNQVTFSLELKDAGDLSIDIYDLLGRKVKSIGELFSDPGIKTVNWNGKNDLGQKLGNGMYFAQPDKNSGLKMVKLVLIK
jgi:hypothetical protein